MLIFLVIIEFLFAVFALISFLTWSFSKDRPFIGVFGYILISIIGAVVIMETVDILTG